MNQHLSSLGPSLVSKTILWLHIYIYTYIQGIKSIKNIKAFKQLKSIIYLAKIVIKICWFKLVEVTAVTNARWQIIPYYWTTIGKTVCVKYFVFATWQIQILSIWSSSYSTVCFTNFFKHIWHVSRCLWGLSIILNKALRWWHNHNLLWHHVTFII